MIEVQITHQHQVTQVALQDATLFRRQPRGTQIQGDALQSPGAQLPAQTQVQFAGQNLRRGQKPRLQPRLRLQATAVHFPAPLPAGRLGRVALDVCGNAGSATEGIG